MIALIRRDLVMLPDHLCDLDVPLGLAVVVQVVVREFAGRRQVIEGVVGPDTKVVKDCGDRNLFTLGHVRQDGDAKIGDPVNVIAVGRVIVAELASVGTEYLVYRNYLLKKFSQSGLTCCG